MNPFDLLPNEVVADILACVQPIQELGKLSIVCARFHALQNEKFWRRLCLRWWKEKPYQKTFDLDKIVRESIALNESNGWKFFFRCFSREYDFDSKKAGPAWAHLPQYLIILEIGVFGSGGELHGWGIRGWLNQKFTGHVFVGNFEEGYFQGEGAYFWPNGRSLIGKFMHDKVQGHAKIVWPTGFVYDGDFQSDEPADRESALHPKIKAALAKNLCTSTVTKDGQEYGQFCAKYTGHRDLWLCESCAKICQYYQMDPDSLPSPKQKWTFGTDHCYCFEHPENCHVVTL